MELKDATGSQGVLISTVMLCWNRLELTQKCLQSYFDTVSVPFELFILNNASTDGTKNWLDRIQGDERIKEVIHMERNDPAAALNFGLEKCAGRYLHVMENDYIYQKGWDRYALDCFEGIPELGQLGISTGAKRLHGMHYRDLVVLSKKNVISSSIFPRNIFFHHGIKWKNTAGGYMPHDGDFSKRIKDLGLLIAHPDRLIAISVGQSEEEFERDPDYYVRNYRLKLFTFRRLKNEIAKVAKGRNRETNLDNHFGRMMKLYRLKMKQIIGSHPGKK